MLQITKIMPPSTMLVTTGEKFAEDMYDEHGLIESKKGDLKPYQKVVAIGPMVRNIKVGDMVMINVMHFAVFQYDSKSLQSDAREVNKIKEFRFNWIDLYDEDGGVQECLYMDQQDIMFAFEGKEVQGKKNSIILPKSNPIITN